MGRGYARSPGFFPKCSAHLDTLRCIQSIWRISFAILQVNRPRYTPLVQLISILETALPLSLSSMFRSFALSLSLSFLSFFYLYASLPFYLLSTNKRQASSVRLTTCTSSRCFIRRRPLSRPVSLNSGISVISLIGNRSCDLQCLAWHTGN